jgi:hypothetical protein
MAASPSSQGVPMRVPVLLLCACLLSAAARADDPPPDAGSDPGLKAIGVDGAPAGDEADEGGDLRSALDQVAQLARANDLAGAQRVLARVLADPEFATLPTPAQLYALTSAGWLAGVDGDNARALTLYRRASELPEADASVWEARALHAWLAGEHGEATSTLATLAKRWPEALPDVDPPIVFQIVEKGERGTPERIALLQALVDAGYAPRRGDDASRIGVELALERLASGDAAAAKAALASVTGAREISMLRADRRFDALIDRDDPHFDVARAARRRVDDLRARALLDQDLLGLQAWLVQGMLTVGEADNALALADEVDGAFAASPDPGYRDPEQLRWMRLFRAHALLYLERDDDAEAALVAAAAPSASGWREPTAVVLLGAVQCSRGRPADALATVAGVDGPDDYLQMLRESVRLCAATQNGDDAVVAEALAWVAAHRTVDEDLHTEALLWAGRVDEAAATLIARLRDPALRGEALVELQDYREPPTLPGERRLTASWDAVRARADVQAAVAAVGRIETYPIFEP